uniref:Uncharacterized protein n=1 Tax=uncultured marine microorganism HF4000_APKG8L7 TaxID=455556 RepID=B3TB88_9ZZZZ|nr:hypothetical protein ALOHA_HF4000APKG8L7ctg1g22 [uncultured marine microorganism HF4000_APKG8L7]
MTAAHPVASWPPIRTGVCHAGRSVPSRHEKLTGPRLPSPNQPNRERAIAYRDGSGPNSRSDAHCAIIVGDWEEPSGESRINMRWTIRPAFSLAECALIGNDELRTSVTWRTFDKSHRSSWLIQ